ncbi:ribosomal RNA small subunit methyltransferase E [Limoniibacter endophyticus]|uniref:Ribosomal RNA small subunit methyltransferase E n=1 Tax=Limoniibacter endophyticus TaxID=1565040 RepID=A0A8J3DLH9_9HYPH|nr:ribosomal RNA small subunit methyltransferase E [Limoniibacter endophyticus]
MQADHQQSHYLAHVLRYAEGTELLVFNGRDGEWRAVVEKITKKGVSLRATNRERPQSPPSDLIYCFAPLKVGRLDYMIQKAVEMGAGTLIPVITQHVQNHRLQIDKLKANAVEAAEQCGILSLPEVRQPMKLDALLVEWDPERALIFCDEAAEGDDPLPALSKLTREKLGLIIGPEGGFSAAEREMLRAAAFVTPIPLGPRILRADTAAVAAMAVLQAVAGDWKS